MTHVAMFLSNPFRPDPRVYKEARSLTQASYSVTVVGWDRRKEFPTRERIDGFEVRRIAVRSNYSAGSRQMFYLPQFWLHAMQELRSLSPDIVHCHDLDTTPVGYWYARRHCIPWLLDAHECYPEQMRPQVNRIIYFMLLILERGMVRRASHTITVGTALAQRFRAMGGQVSVVGNYQSPTALASRLGITRADLGLHPGEFVIAYIGGFTYDRAILPFVKAAGYLQNATILLLGSGPQRAAIESVLPNFANVRYLGQVPQEQVLDYTALADVIYYGLEKCHSNTQYSTPNAHFNALAAGKPVLTTNIGEIAQIVREEQCGVVVEQATPELLAEAITRLRAPAFREPLAANARRAAQTKYNWAAAEAVLLNVYEQVIGARIPAGPEAGT